MKMKAVFLAALVFMVFQGTANASEMWVADGVRQVAASNSTNPPVVLPFTASGFATEQLCLDYIADQNTLALSNTTKGYGMANKVNGKCSKMKDAPQ